MLFRNRERLSLLPAVESTGTCRKTALSPIRANNDIDVAPVAAPNTDRVLGPLDSAYPWSLHGRLNDFP
jgi:hypothetical protein